MKPNETKLAAVVVPLSNRTDLTDDEQISFRHLAHYLGGYDKFLIVPQTLKVNYAGFGIKRFGNHFFGSAQAHSRLLLSKEFYEAFTLYQYILIYHLDALVFSDQLADWCKKGYDFIGPPWIRHDDAPNAKFPELYGKVGNGGFSLRKVSSFLRVVDSSTRTHSLTELVEKYMPHGTGLAKWTGLPKVILRQLGVRNNVRHEMSQHSIEEVFWANRATHYHPGFNIPSVETALRFGFEYLPRYCHEKNGFKLPFGCHAWNKYDRSFWEPHLLNND